MSVITFSFHKLVTLVLPKMLDKGRLERLEGSPFYRLGRGV